MEAQSLIQTAERELKGFISSYININAYKSDKINVDFSDNKLSIGFNRKNEFFRGLNLYKRFSEKDSFSVSEYSRFENLALLVDCSRNAVMTVDAVKKLIRIMALSGYNELQLYTEDTYEVEGEPYFGYLRGRYSSAELTELVNYGLDFGIELVPCIETLAHIESIFRWRAYGQIRDCNDILLVEEDRTYQLIENMFKSLRKSFKGSKINICMDEAHMLGLGQYLKKHGFVDRQLLMIRHIKKVAEIAQKYGFKPVMWSDMFFKLAFGGEYYIPEGVDDIDISPEVLKGIPEGVQLFYWDYYSKDKSRYDRMIKFHQKFPNKIGFAGAAWNFTGFTPNIRFSFETTEKALQSCIENGVKDVIMTTWGDNGADCPVFYTLAGLLYAAEIAFGKGITETNDSLKAITGCSMEDFMKLEYPNLIDETSMNEYTNPSKYLLYNDLFLGMYDTTIKEGTGNLLKKYAEELIQSEKRNTLLMPLFKRQRLMCEALSLKVELGIATRAAYKRGDIGTLKELAKNNYSALINKLEEFYECFKEEWFSINKPFGFEVQDARLCGLIGRVKSCQNRLNDFTEGKISKIEELEEDLIDYLGYEQFTKRTFCFNSWAGSITTGVV